MNDNINIRIATLNDINFIVEAIIEAEKSGTEKGGIAALFNLTEDDFRKYLKNILEEKIDGCEFSLSGFLVLTVNCKVVAAAGGFVEEYDKDNLPSAIVKANLLSFHFPKGNLKYGFSKSEILKGFQIQREKGTYQIDNVYVDYNYRGRNYAGLLLEAHTSLCEKFKCNKMQLQVYPINIPAIRCYERAGFKISHEFISENIEILNYYPCDRKYLMQKDI